MLIFAEKYDRNKEEKRKMKRIISILLYMAVLLPLAAQPPKHEVRAAWITAVYGLDWPQTPTTSPEGIRKQQAELIEILDRLKAANFNTVLFQTRTRGDVLYKSAIEPYNSILTGKVGGDPGYDPLAFAIAECHKRTLVLLGLQSSLLTVIVEHVVKHGDVLDNNIRMLWVLTIRV